MRRRPARDAFRRRVRALGRGAAAAPLWLRGALVAVVVAAASVTVVAVRSSDGPLEDIASAGRLTAAAGSARMATTTLVDGGIGAVQQRIDAGGVIDFSRGDRQLELLVGGAGRDGAAASTGVAMSLIDTPGATFVRYDSWPADRPWVRYPAGEAGIDELVHAQRWDLLGEGGSRVRVVGEDTVRGETTTHYSMTVDLAAVRAAAAADGLDLIEAAAGDGGMSMDVWVSGEVRRVRYVLDVPRPSSGAAAEAVGPGASVSTVIEYYDFGLPVQITEPASAVNEELTGSGDQPAPVPEAVPTP